MLRYEKQQYVFKNGEFPLDVEEEAVKYVGGSPVSLNGAKIAGADTLAKFSGVAGNNYACDKELGRGTAYKGPAIFTLEKGFNESSSYKQHEDPCAPWEGTLAAGDVLIPGTHSVETAYAVWKKGSDIYASGDPGFAKVIEISADQKVLTIELGVFFIA